MARIASVDCGAGIWQQNFSYDNNAWQSGVTGGPFGNLIKSVPTGGTGDSFQPTYNLTTNQISSLPGFTPSYDANGNVLNDSLHQYTWDAEGRPVTVDSISLVYDALGRMVEQTWGSSHAQLVYDPLGRKLAIANNQNPWWVRVPLPGGGAAVYNPSLAYYGHPDWLGSHRFTSTTTAPTGPNSDAALAPFGEMYAVSGTAGISFTGQYPDTTGPGWSAGDFDFLFREYNVQGRWASPDPAGLAAVNLADPQKSCDFSTRRVSLLRVSPSLTLSRGGTYTRCGLQKGSSACRLNRSTSTSKGKKTSRRS